MTDDGTRHLFSAVDEAPDPHALVDHMDHLRAMDPLREVKRHNFELLNIVPGTRILDIGCGPGDDARDLARLVGSDGRVVGIDLSETMISEARLRSRETDLPVEFRAMDATKLDFPDCSFDGVRADRVLQHVDDPVTVLNEMIRVTRPGCFVVISDTDWGMMGIDMTDRELTQRLLNFGFNRMISNPWIGRQLLRLFRDAGLGALRVVPHAVVPTSDAMPPGVLPQLMRLARQEQVISAEEEASWKHEFDERSAAGTLFVVISMFTVAGQKP